MYVVYKAFPPLTVTWYLTTSASETWHHNKKEECIVVFRTLDAACEVANKHRASVQEA